MKHAVVVPALLLTVAAGSGARGAPAAPELPVSSAHAHAHTTDAFVARVEALALLQTLNAELLASDSATQTLERWCRDHQLAPAPQIVVQRVPAAARQADAPLRRELRVAPDEEIRYRHVRLVCGTRVLSEADNWYVPSRLSAAMNRQLDSTDVPFGAVVRELHYQRHTLASRLLWQPLAPGWEMGVRQAGANGANGADDAPLVVPDKVLEHRALLSLPDGTPISLVIETYSGNVLAFPIPAGSATGR